MKFIYTPSNGMANDIEKYDIKFTAGKAVDVTDLSKAEKLQKCAIFSVMVEVEKEDPKPVRTRRSKEQMIADKAQENGEN